MAMMRSSSSRSSNFTSSPKRTEALKQSYEKPRGMSLGYLVVKSLFCYGSKARVGLVVIRGKLIDRLQCELFLVKVRWWSLRALCICQLRV